MIAARTPMESLRIKANSPMTITEHSQEATSRKSYSESGF